METREPVSRKPPRSGLLSRDPPRDDLLRRKIADLAGELDLVVAGHLPGVFDHEVLPLKIQGFDEVDTVLGDLSLLDRDRALVAAAVAGGGARELFAFDLEGEDVLLHPDLRIELGLPCACDVAGAGKARHAEHDAYQREES